MAEISPLPWVVDPDEREGYEWNAHIVEAARPHMRVCFMSNGLRSEANAAFIVKACNLHEALVKALESIAGWRKVNLSGEYEHSLRDIIRSITDCAAAALDAAPVGGSK